VAVVVCFVGVLVVPPNAYLDIEAQTLSIAMFGYEGEESLLLKLA
jgi:hypothetical protein